MGRGGSPSQRWRSLLRSAAQTPRRPRGAVAPLPAGLGWFFGGATGENKIVATSEAVLGLQAVGGHADAIDAAQLFLPGPATVDEQARRIAALAGSPFADNLGATLLTNALQPTAGGVAFAPGFASSGDGFDVVETALALQAVAPTGSSPAALVGLQDTRLVAQRRRFHRWHLADNASDFETTALSAQALSPFRFMPEIPGLVNLIIQSQNPGHPVVVGRVRPG